MTVGNETLYFTYGAMGPSSVIWDGEPYYYVLNGQGDVTAILDADGIPVVWYNWDNAWGYYMFAYCLNNPVNMIDQSGEIPKNNPLFRELISGNLIL